MAINDKDFYASHGISYDIEEMQIEYTKRVIKQAKIEVLTELQSEIEEKASAEGDWIFAEGERFCGKLIQQKINSLKEA